MDIEKSRELGKLLVRSQDGDAEAYREFLKILYAFVEKALRGKGLLEIEDLAQEVILSIHKGRHTFNPECEFYPWFYAILNRRVVDFKRKSFREKRKIGEFQEFVEVESMEGGLGDDDEGRERVLREMENLTEVQRRVINMSKVEGYSLAEIGAEMGLSLENVKVIAHRGIKKLKHLVSKEK